MAHVVYKNEGGTLLVPPSELSHPHNLSADKFFFVQFNCKPCSCNNIAFDYTEIFLSINLIIVAKPDFPSIHFLYIIYIFYEDSANLLRSIKVMRIIKKS